jgi:hypothetical protein
VTTLPENPTTKQVEAHTKRGFALERKIKAALGAVHASWWTLSKSLYEFHEGGYWGSLGYETLEEFLVQPDLGLSRRQFFLMTQLWRDLVVVKQIEPERLEALEPSKVREVLPAIMRGDVAIDDALDDAAGLGYRDVVEKYRKQKAWANA